MKVIAILLAFLLIYKLRISHAKAKTKNDAYAYLMRYGYMSSMSELSGGAVHIKTVVTDFQRYARIPVTGKMDETTIAKLNSPRCGAKDRELKNVARGIPVSFNDMRRRKRYVQQGSMWDKLELTYSLHGKRKPNQKISSAEVERTLNKAFQMWQTASVLTFTNIGYNKDNAEIIIKFGAGVHGDPYPFDDRGGTLAHGFYPHNNQGLSGDVHFDDDEEWTLKGEPDTTDFLWTAIHEIGHAIGLGHAETPNAIMWPWFQGYKSNLRLKKDDIDGIRSIYGAPTLVSPPSVIKSTTTSTICRYTNFDAVMYNKRSRNTYFFKDDKVWAMDANKMAGNHERINRKWPGLVGNIDAAYTRADGTIIFFKGNRYWKYSGTRKLTGPTRLSHYIRNINTHYKGKQSNRLDRIDAVMIWDGNGKTYFFRRDKYWRYNERTGKLSAGYPRPLAKWKNVKTPVYGVMSWKNRKTFFFHRDEMYRFKNKEFKVKIKKGNKNKINYFISNCHS